MRLNYTYKSFPDCPEATEYSHNRSEGTTKLMFLFSSCTFFAIFVFVLGILDLFKYNEITTLLWSFLVFFLMSIFAFYLFCVRNLKTEYNTKIFLMTSKKGSMTNKEIITYFKQLKKDNKKIICQRAIKYYIYFFVSSILLYSLVGIIKIFLF